LPPVDPGAVPVTVPGAGVAVVWLPLLPPPFPGPQLLVQPGLCVGGQLRTQGVGTGRVGVGTGKVGAGVHRMQSVGSGLFRSGRPEFVLELFWPVRPPSKPP
jgi:hypothetical protein